MQVPFHIFIEIFMYAQFLHGLQYGMLEYATIGARQV